ncbi:hypothetical protein [Paraburkholderia sp. BCC1885]|uniref:hypothetical protein n=1 Tax=Paraburkholderia sp. BCC1885 TaxID=2562669 RepID=UPI001183CE1D|nr:hypothetical protein [Paraburkholderia sp. BCC1885]
MIISIGLIAGRGAGLIAGLVARRIHNLRFFHGRRAAFLHNARGALNGRRTGMGAGLRGAASA